ncbi:MAG: excinuclease ABC subunit UvrA [Saprospiraceae bacterium]|nr:excinuclease ABC subunit UvrA [Saprospiraceae bacterium]
MVYKNNKISVIGARENNLNDFDIDIPKNKLVVITGISGSGKSSLAFDTIYAEGQRRYMETFSAYVRQFLGKMERPDVEQITGLSPVISIEQKSTGWNPRSTVGTTTEIYDFFRLLFAKIGEAYSYISGKRMVKYTEEQIIDVILRDFDGKKIAVLAPMVRGRKGHYRELFDQIRKRGYSKARVDGEILDLKAGFKVDRYQTHDIEIVIDRIKVEAEKRDRICSSILLAMKLGENLMMINDTETNKTYPFSKSLICPDSGISYEEPSPNSFSFNTPYGYCGECKGLGTINTVDLEKVIPDRDKNINQQGIAPFGEVRDTWTFKQLKEITKKYNFDYDTPVKDIPEEALKIILYGGNDDFKYDFNFGLTEFTYNLAYEGLVNMIKRWYENTTSEKIRAWAEEYMTVIECPECKGYRLKKESLHFKIAEKNIGEISCLDLNELLKWVSDLETVLPEKQLNIGREIIKELKVRIEFLLQVGLSYLSLNRPSRTLSGGESQRTRLATQIGSKLTGITYILDEPSIGLHSRDNRRLINALKKLTYLDNTVIVVEHDKEIMLESDYLIDLGPGAGKHGGNIIAKGIPADFLTMKGITSEYLSGRKKINVPEFIRPGTGKNLTLEGANGNNLQNVDITIPLGTFICVTGVSGSGKSTLINDTLYPILRQELHNSIKKPLPYQKISGIENIDKVIEIDQDPIGRTPRSNPATYTGLFTHIRKLFSMIPDAKIRGYDMGRFSFNVKGGRCETCQGSGMMKIEMNFLPDVYVECEVCSGRRYTRETLEVLYKGKTISDVLDMTVEEAYHFFEHIPAIKNKLETLLSVGLSYISLGQQATTLSGGEAQRVKLAEELSKKDTGKTLYILDEPTTGLHFEDIKHLIDVLNRLVERKNTVLVIEHNMDIIKSADYIIDLGPEGGNEGGKVIFQGKTTDLLQHQDSYTAYYLKEEYL